ncbi:MAG: hypothetical protein U0167_01110 [bacterium]
MGLLQVWISAALTLFILSFLYRDNPLYKLAEHVFVGISAGYYFALEFQETIRPNLWNPVVHDAHWVRLGALVLSLLMFSRFFGRISWLSRWPIAFVVGMYAGINVIAFGSGDLVIQLEATMLDFLHGGLLGVSNLLLVVGLATSLLYFYFSREHRGALGVASRVGVWFLMVSFGASFGYTVMSRVSLAIGRARYLMGHPFVSTLLVVGVAAALFAWARSRGRGPEQGSAA